MMCEWQPAQFLILYEHVPNFIYYSHLAPSLLALLFGGYVYFQNRKSPLNQILFLITLLFAGWSWFDLILWNSITPGVIMFFWSILIYIEPAIYASTFYFVYLFIKGKDLSWRAKLLTITPFIPLLLLAHTSYNLTGFDMTNCDREAIEGPLWYYTYFIEALFVFSIACIGIKNFFAHQTNTIDKQKIINALIGSLLFLGMFSWGNVIGSFTLNWASAQYGLFGMPLFIGFLSYLVIKHNVLNVKILEVQAITGVLGFLLFAILFLRNIESVRIVVAITFIIFIFLATLLVRSMRKEIVAHEKANVLAEDMRKMNNYLADMNNQKSEFVSFATHQLRSPLTAMKGYLSMTLEGDYGAVPANLSEPLKRVYESSINLTRVVEDYLDTSRIELGAMKYNFASINFKELIQEVVLEMQPSIEKAKLTIVFESTGEDIFVNADTNKMRQVISNLIDNAIKYTPQGSIRVRLDKIGNYAHVLITDTGVGISFETLKILFNKFTRANNADKINIRGTGLGLYVAKEIVLAHKGKVWAESEGEGKGSQFYVEIPTV